jgi:K+-sensing histidine kinase KdpD
MIIINDISELIKVEYARSVEKISDIMIASTSHDMRTPLNTIINMHKLIECNL